MARNRVVSAEIDGEDVSQCSLGIDDAMAFTNSFGGSRMLYFKRYWDEPRGDEHNSWGCSWWYFEVDNTGAVVRQIEVYDNGPSLCYDENRPDNEFGRLAVQPLDVAAFAEFEILQVEFDRVWDAVGKARPTEPISK